MAKTEVGKDLVKFIEAGEKLIKTAKELKAELDKLKKDGGKQDGG